uniref:BPI1 domain-containing protein n=1 Tax=Thelazia callipaeda TaxID=103827 RepID=A0A0N5CJU1_THECL
LIVFHSAFSRKNVNSRLFSNIRGLPGLEFRISNYGFSYISLFASPVISDEIKRIRFPLTEQCFQQLKGCITIRNLYIARYRCPQLVSIIPTPPKRLTIIVRNFDVSATIQLTVHRASKGYPYMKVFRCHVSIGYTDVLIQNGGFVGNIFNTQFRVRLLIQ